ncbi:MULTISPECIES: glycoside hydrolase family 15 protein [unclassified Microbacterium]|uniref:glycoside hydrolase family 15 protein n=1 Tax=unclassified Microbacterium TaxID=2609290 RepID=UPI00214AF712|nr:MULTISPECIES: glycoside hydrolase family 15 protein [unclassified Microbacterium]MCR2784177.1 glycoside hydrolase family 15 protein [Microbacterium sp. zg.B96]WIM14989.1 glycoside hydrolase family 15 protein [Microbacterium sp. zg-B96]
MNEYPLIADHGLIGDLQTSALVATDGTIDWFCSPRFDSPSIFGALLDHARGGHLSVRPRAEAFQTKQLYFPDTAILITRFLTENGVGEVIDFMPVASDTASARHRLVREVRCVRGEIVFDIEIAPRFDYGRQAHEVAVSADGATYTAGETTLTVSLIRDPDLERLGKAESSEAGDLRVSVSLTEGQMRGLVLEMNSGAPPRAVPVAEAERLFDDTAHYWQDWIGQSAYTGRWREELERSAITLKLLTYAPTGGLVAAPTAGLPEQIGGERNWDYRFTWVRDASFSVTTLVRMGFRDEAAAFGRWLRDRVAEHAGSDTGPLNIMYRIDGDPHLSEETLEDWEGYRKSYPVRIGNDAAGQLQLDIYGEAMDALWHAHKSGVPMGQPGWLAVGELLDWLADNWDQPEEGIWETRGGRKDFTYGRLMCWVAFDRAIRLAGEYGRPAPLSRWIEQRDAIYNQIMAKGWNAERRAFVQQYGETVLDASLLKMTQVGFISPHDPMWTDTLAAMETELVSDSLVYRYDPSASPDGLRGSEGTFSLCTFLYVDALARADRLDDARLTFEKMLTYANHLGLFSEEIAPTGEQIGNFPQAFTHLALIDAAITLDERMNAHRPSRRAH